ncbi:hypothetical protein FQZ97_865180 [compost metagenome]
MRPLGLFESADLFFRFNQGRVKLQLQAQLVEPLTDKLQPWLALDQRMLRVVRRGAFLQRCRMIEQLKFNLAQDCPHQFVSPKLRRFCWCCH